MQQRQVSRGHRRHLPRHQLCHPTTQDNWKSQYKLDTINCNTQYLQGEHDINLQRSFHHLIIIPTPTITEINWTHASPSLLLFWLGWTTVMLPWHACQTTYSADFSQSPTLQLSQLVVFDAQITSQTPWPVFNGYVLLSVSSLLTFRRKLKAYLFQQS